MGGLSDGVTPLSLDGKVEVTDTSEDGERYAPGMKTGLKHLYSGTEDKQGRFQWQDTIPEDIGKAAENDGTAKWALLVRNIKVYNDPRRILLIHSIVVQSPYLKKFLASVLKSYPIRDLQDQAHYLALCWYPSHQIAQCLSTGT
jgi:hypothetical protein